MSPRVCVTAQRRYRSCTNPELVVGTFFATATVVRVIPLLMCLLFVTGCDEKSPAGPTVPLNQRFTLAPGEAAVVEIVDLRVQFLEVTGDSRCPADAVCIQGGDAIVGVRVSGGGTKSAVYGLHTGDSSRASVVHGRVRIALVELQPFPFSSRTIAPGDYRATFTVTSQGV